MLDKRPMMPSAGEDKDKFISRCIKHEMEKNPEMGNDQAAAICYSYWEKKSAPDGFTRATIENELPAEKDVDIELINKYAISPLARADIYARSMYLCNDLVDSYNSRFPVESLAQIVALIPGEPVLKGHNYNSLPIARFYKANMEVIDGVTWVRSWFYWLKNTEGADDLVKNIDGGIYREVSIGWRYHKSICIICGQEIGSCPHIPGNRYSKDESSIEEKYKEDENGELCYYEMTDIKEVMEGSLVFKGGQVGTHMAGERNKNIERKEDIQMTEEEKRKLVEDAKKAGAAEAEQRLASDIDASKKIAEENRLLKEKHAANRKAQVETFITGLRLVPLKEQGESLRTTLLEISEESAAKIMAYITSEHLRVAAILQKVGVEVMSVTEKDMENLEAAKHGEQRSIDMEAIAEAKKSHVGGKN